MTLRLVKTVQHLLVPAVLAGTPIFIALILNAFQAFKFLRHAVEILKARFRQFETPSCVCYHGCLHSLSHLLSPCLAPTMNRLSGLRHSPSGLSFPLLSSPPTPLFFSSLIFMFSSLPFLSPTPFFSLLFLLFPTLSSSLFPSSLPLLPWISHFLLFFSSPSLLEPGSLSCTVPN